jgi:surface antigen
MTRWVWFIAFLLVGGVAFVGEARAASSENENSGEVIPEYHPAWIYRSLPFSGPKTGYHSKPLYGPETGYHSKRLYGPKTGYHSKPLYGPDTGYHDTPFYKLNDFLSRPDVRIHPPYGVETEFPSPPPRFYAPPRESVAPEWERGQGRVLWQEKEEILRAAGDLGPSYPIAPSQIIHPGQFSRARLPHQANKPKREAPPEQLILRVFFSKTIRSKPGRRDQVKMARLTQLALEQTLSGMLLQWDNPDSGKKGTVRVSNRFRDEAGVLCSHLQQSVSFQGNTDIAYGIACLGPDGLWKVSK